MEPTEAINTVEVVLRSLVREVIGDSWQSVSSIDIAKLEEKRAAELAKRRGVAVPDDLLAFTEFYQLRNIVNNRWNEFSDALGKKKYFDVYMDRLEGFRNPAMHSRSLLPFEEALVHGITGELRNLIAIYRSRKEGNMEFYPVIDSIIDSFGHQLTTNQYVEIPLRPGEQVTFRCAGTDPDGRALIWNLNTNPPIDGLSPTDQAIGNEVTLTWTVGDNQVGERTTVLIEMASTGPHHRHHTFDGGMVIWYRVDPPL
ncbi:hypothetical protein [Rhodococcus rhodochrous]|uniref:hypothetical protein n=1 Tax=Rhodococcus rhodochrous TaxID=1829 RepID=UPI0017841AD7|nr:hypothetical protein [Rhodococcus rhodochrous]QOH56242.1 hypothetical protein C6Y44_09900 [Rhodococcus rhodochrous]